MTRAPLAFALFFGLAGLVASCSRKEPRREDPSPKPECETRADCGSADPCTEADCVDGACTKSFAAAGQSCDNDSVCDGVAKCDGRGHCVAGAAPVIDDGNPCTVDSCDPAFGPRHAPVPVDDGDVCTRDACNPVTGEITHDPEPTDDGDDCTFDSCDPKAGVQHRRVEAFYSCDASCGDGFHAASRAPAEKCGSRTSLQTFCVPDCGPSFYSCASQCPERYAEKARTASGTCGPDTPTQVFCVAK